MQKVTSFGRNSVFGVAPKTPERRVSSKTSNFLHFNPPYWTRHFEIRNFVFRFIIIDPENSQLLSFIRNKSLLYFDPPFWIRLFEFSNFYFKFGFRDPKKPHSTPGIQIWMKIKAK